MDPSAESYGYDIHTENRFVPKQTMPHKRLKEDTSLLNHNPRDPKHTYVGDSEIINEYVPQRNALGVQLYYGRKELGKRYRSNEHNHTNDNMMYHGVDEFLNGVPVNVVDGPRDFDKMREFTEVVQLDDLTNKTNTNNNQVQLSKYKTAGEIVKTAKENFIGKTHYRDDHEIK